MEYVNLEPGWLQKQIKATQEEVRSWPASFRDQANSEPQSKVEANTHERCAAEPPPEKK